VIDRSAAIREGLPARRVVRLTLRLGVVLLTSGAQSHETEDSARAVMRAFGLPGGEAIVTFSSVMVSYVAPGDARTTTAIQAVRQWRYDFGQLAAADALAKKIRDGSIDIPEAEAELDRIAAMATRYPAWLRFAAPAVLSAAVTIMFGGRLTDSLATLAIGLAIQPALARIERSALPLFFQTVFGVAATALLVVLLTALRLPVDAGLVLTGGLLRFLPGSQLVAGMRDLIARAIMPGAANLAEVALLGVAIAISASLTLALGQAVLGIDLQISAQGQVDWARAVTVLAGAVAVAAYCVRLGVPRTVILSVTLLGTLAVLIVGSPALLSKHVDRDGSTLIAALAIGCIGRYLANRRDLPAALWLVPAILPLLPAPATLLPLLAESEQARQALLAQALNTAFLIGVGVASGDILVSAYQDWNWWRR
jgi:uncharacterized membrane protein YjjP (DUF1212 family)/uncharacterized membrane protein YjjB (DUF3815 family)